MKAILLCIGMVCAIVMSSTKCRAQNQTPKYKYTSYTGTGSGGFDFHSQGAPKHQCIYLKTDFLGMPEGYPTAVYLRVGREYGPSTPNPTIWDSMRIRMGYTSDTAFVHHTPNLAYDTFYTSLTTVFMQPKFTVYGADSVGTWVRFPLNMQAGFNYNRQKNLIVDISRAYRASLSAYGFDWMNSNQAPKRALSGEYDSIRTSYLAYGHVFDIGFDFPGSGPSGIAAQESLRDFYTYPNPAPGGRFTAGFERSGGGEALITVSDMAGRSVWQGAIPGGGPGLVVRNIDLSVQPKGCYLLRVSNSEGSAARTVMLE